MAKQTALESLPVNIYEAEDQLTVALPVPGAHHDTISLRLDGTRLTIDAEPRYTQAQQHYLQHEWTVGRWHREVDLPKPVRAAGAKAMLTHGILTISLPLGTERPAARTAIQVSEPQVHQGQPH